MPFMLLMIFMQFKIQNIILDESKPTSKNNNKWVPQLLTIILKTYSQYMNKTEVQSCPEPDTCTSDMLIDVCY